MFKCEVDPSCVSGLLCVPLSLIFTYTSLMLAPQVTQHIATCQPLSGALDNGHVILCDMMADPWVSVPSPSWIQSPVDRGSRRA